MGSSTMSKTAAFPKILAIGHKEILTLFEGEVEITENWMEANLASVR